MKIFSYEPLPKQVEFHKLNTRYKAFIGGFGSGKTKAGVWEVIDKGMKYPKNTILIARKYGTDLRDSTQKMFFDECPPQLIREYIKSQRKVVLINDTEIFFRGLDDLNKVRALNLGMWLIDEASEIQYEIFDMLKGRLRLDTVPRHYGIIVTNPPNTNHWIYKCFVEKQDKDYSYVQTSSFDNTFLPKEYLENLMKEYPESWIRRYLKGEFGFVQQGLPVFKGFSEKIHTADLTYIKGKTILRGWDFGWHHPAVVWCQIDMDDRFCVLKENLGAQIYLDEYADKIINISNSSFPGCDFEDFCDPAGLQKTDKATLTSIDILKKKGINPRYKKMPIMSGLDLIQRKINSLIGEKPGFLVDKKCRFLIEAMIGGYYYEKVENGYGQEQPYKDGLYEHICDALRYIFSVKFASNSVNNFKINIKEPKWMGSLQ